MVTSYLREAMAKSTKRTRSNKGGSETPPSKVSEPQAVYARKASRPSTRKPSARKGYDAKRSAGMLPGIADWYVDSLRDEARQTMDKADHLSKAMLRGTKRDKRKTDDARIPGLIDVDRFSGALPHLKGDAVRTQRKLRDEA